MPTILVSTSRFEDLARELASFKGFPSRIVSIEHPLGGLVEGEVVERAGQAVEEVLALIRQ